jgi:hypothetical protein
MSFKRDLARTCGLEDAWQPGLQALSAPDRARITVKPSSKLDGSADIDAALLVRFPGACRWDYVVAWKAEGSKEFLHWIEVHPADGTGTITEISDKLAWLKDWLARKGTLLRKYQRKLVWIASGRSAFRQNGPQLKRLALAGLYFAGGHYIISD